MPSVKFTIKQDGVKETPGVLVVRLLENKDIEVIDVSQGKVLIPSSTVKFLENLSAVREIIKAGGWLSLEAEWEP